MLLIKRMNQVRIEEKENDTCSGRSNEVRFSRIRIISFISFRKCIE